MTGYECFDTELRFKEVKKLLNALLDTITLKELAMEDENFDGWLQRFENIQESLHSYGSMIRQLEHDV